MIAAAGGAVMTRLARKFSLGLVIGFAARVAFAQQAGPPQDPKLDNLVHEEGYVTARPGTLGAVVERGHGPIDMVLISGFGLGASAFEEFMDRNAKRYRMLAVTLPGFEGSAAPPMPPAGTSYGEQTWTRAATEAVVGLIRARKLVKPVLVGHSLNGTQVAAGVAIDHPELVRALVLLAGSSRFEPVTPMPYWPRGLTLDKKVVMVDDALAPRWFKTVTRATWVANNFVATDYSVELARGRTFAERANSPPLPVLIRYLCEFHASDVLPGIAHGKFPLLIVQPLFTQAVRSDPKRNYVLSYFREPWQGAFAGRPQTTATYLNGAGILVMDDQPGEVDRAIAAFLRPLAR